MCNQEKFLLSSVLDFSSGPVSGPVSGLVSVPVSVVAMRFVFQLRFVSILIGSDVAAFNLPKPYLFASNYLQHYGFALQLEFY